MKAAITFVYYVSFAWMTLLVIAELGALAFPKTYWPAAFLTRYFFTSFTYFALIFIVGRFLVIVVSQYKSAKKMNS